MAQIVNLTPRSFLASLTPPLATDGARGRFSKDGVAALDKARADGFLFIGDAGHPLTEVKVPKAPKAPKPAPKVTASAPTQVQVAAPAISFDAKEVRSWAKANGHVVGERGRIRPEVTAAFAQAGGKPVGERAKRPTPADMPKVRPQTQAWAVIGPRKGEGQWAKPFILGVEKCGKGHRIQSCSCSVPATNAQWGNAPLSLTKPVL